MSVLYYTINNEVFRGFIFYAIASVIKMMAMSLLTAFHRLTKNIFANPEDVPASARKTLKVTTSDSIVERVRRNHLNDIENVVPFVLIGFFYIGCNPSLNIALWHFRIFFISRLLHTLSYQIPIPQPSRALCFLVGYLVVISMAVQALLVVL